MVRAAGHSAAQALPRAVVQGQDKHIADGFYQGGQAAYRQGARETVSDTECDGHVKQDLAGLLCEHEHGGNSRMRTIRNE